MLDSVEMVSAEHDKTLWVVAGHTDGVGDESLNLGLSQQRASTISGYLRSKSILAGRLDTTGFGETQPIARNTSPEGKKLNRRVEITLLPITAG